VDDDHRVGLPWRAGDFVSHASPEVDNFLAADVGAAGATQLPTAREVLLERVTDWFESATDVSLNNM
jgi:hypothetical protein